MKRFSTLLLALTVILFIGGCDSNGSDPGNGDGDGIGDGDLTGELFFDIRIEAANGGIAAVEYAYECYDTDGVQTGASGSGTISTSQGSITTNMCAGFGIVADATYDNGSSPIDVQILASSTGFSEEDESVIAVETLQDEGDETRFLLGTGPGS